jgi:anti-sigma factor RsiW
MNHDDAIRSAAFARYLLGEMNDSERDQYEAHFFECRICANKIRVGFELMESLRAAVASRAPSVSPARTLRRCRLLMRVHANRINIGRFW